MTQIRRSKSIPWRETDASYFDTGRNRPIVVAIMPSGILLKLKGTRRQPFMLPYGQAFIWAVRLQVAADRQENLLKLKAKKAGKQ